MIIKWVKDIHKSQTKAALLQKKIKEQHLRIRSLVEEQRILSKWNTQYSNTLNLLTDAIHALIWRKDAQHRYVLANPTHCQSFFGFDGTEECLKFVIGKTDEELIKSIYTDNNSQNTFAATCKVSDEYTSKKIESTHFLEAGIIEEEEVLIYNIKTPQFIGETFVGTIGIAWDVSSRSDFLLEQLNRWIYTKSAERLYHQQNIFCYAIAPKVKECAIFKHLCPVDHDTDSDECTDCGVAGTCFKQRRE